MAISTVVKNLRDGTLYLAEGDGYNLTTGALNAGAKEIEVKYEDGSFSLTVPGPSISNYLDRNEFGDPPQLRYGADQPCTWTFNAQLRDLSDAAYITLESILLNSGYFASTWGSTLNATPACAEVKTLDVKWVVDGLSHCDATDHILIMQYNYITGSLSEGDPSTIAVSGTSYKNYPTVI